MNTYASTLLSPQLRVTQVSDEGPTPSFFIRFRDPINLLTTNWNHIDSADFDLANRMLTVTNIAVFQRAFTSESLWLMENCKGASIPVIYETDDLMLDLPPQSGFKLSQVQKEAIKSMLKRADLLTCSTPALAERLAEYNTRVKVLENYAIPFAIDAIRSTRNHIPHLAIVNTDYFKLTEAKEGFFKALAKAIETLQYRISFFGTTDMAMETLRSQFPESVEIISSFIPWRRSFLSALLQRGINVAIVPLEVAKHHRYKSDIKFLDFASIGVPAVFNHGEIYNRVIHKQNGFLCDGTSAGWLAGLRYFADCSIREECGEAAHATATLRTIEHYASEMVDVMSPLLDLA